MTESSPAPPGRRSDLARAVAGVRARRQLARQLTSRTARRQQFDRLTPPPGATVFLGDSLTEGGEWAEWFPSLAVINRGIGGDTTRDVLTRLGSAIHEPRHVVMLVGTNDLSIGRDVRAIASDIVRIATEAWRLAPRSRLTVQSVLPRTAAFASEVRELNALVADLVPSRSFLDLWPAFADAGGQLEPALTFDGLHLNGDGYARWVSVLRSTLDGD